MFSLQDKTRQDEEARNTTHTLSLSSLHTAKNLPKNPSLPKSLHTTHTQDTRYPLLPQDKNTNLPLGIATARRAVQGSEGQPWERDGPDGRRRGTAWYGGLKEKQGGLIHPGEGEASEEGDDLWLGGSAEG